MTTCRIAKPTLLAQLYNGETGGFRAFIHGKRHAGLRFILDPRGAMPVMPAPEEVALLNYATAEDADGIWYLSHQASELASGRFSSTEDHRAIAPERYRMDVSVNGDSLNISAQCALRFRVLREGVRMVRFELLPDLEVSTVTFDGGSIPFVQEARRHDGSFYLQFPEKLPKDGVHEVVFNYSGGEYIKTVMGQRVPLIQPIRPWYPRIDSVSRALFDITIRVPRTMTAVSVGKLARKTREGSQDVFEWTSDVPLPPVGFQYGDYRLTQRHEAGTGYLIESYLMSAGRSAPVFQGDKIVPVTVPAASSDVALTDANNSVELFEHWYGPLPYGRLGVVESLMQGSLPSLIFLPAATLGGIPQEAFQGGMTTRMARVLDEALPTVASRQWWGGLVMPASFHETWLVRGLADFSAALYDEAVGDTQSMRQHWGSSHDALMQQDIYGLKIREAPPVWFGLMADIHSTRLIPPPVYYTFVSNALLARKGGFIIHMLRHLMRDPETGDRDFIAMMHDFTATYANRSTSTEDFRATVEKHMKPAMIMDRSGNMQWFFDEWVYGIDIPSYSLDYTLVPGEGGQIKLSGVLTQSGVSDDFRMRVRVYARVGKRTIPAIFVPIAGNHSTKFEMTLSEEPKEVLLNAENDVLVERQEVNRVKALPAQ